MTVFVFLAVSSLLFYIWWLLPHFTGVFILALGIFLSFLECSPRRVSILIISLLITGFGSALFNNAILYRAVLMTDWMFAYFYLAAFYFGALRVTNRIVSLRGSNPVLVSLRQATLGARPTPRPADRRRLISRISVAAVILFLCAGTIRLLALNLGSFPPASPPPGVLSAEAREQVMARLRGNTSSPRDLNEGDGLVLSREPLSYFTIYFPRGTEFKARDAMFHRRPFACTIFQTSHGTAVFPGEIPTAFHGRLVTLVERVEGTHPAGARRGKVTQCVAIIPLLSSSGELDYENAVIVEPRSNRDIL